MRVYSTGTGYQKRYPVPYAKVIPNAPLYHLQCFCV
jgi:hypothetical protein